MIRAARLAVSRPMYAFDPSTWRVHRFDLAQYRTWAGDRPASYADGQPTGGTVRAVWFRRKRGQTVATMGTYNTHVMRSDDYPASGDYASWVAAADDNRYGGGHEATWDGRVLLNTDPPAVTPEVAAARIEFLDAMLRGFPDPPPGFDGWWTFERRN